MDERALYDHRGAGAHGAEGFIYSSLVDAPRPLYVDDSEAALFQVIDVLALMREATLRESLEQGIVGLRSFDLSPRDCDIQAR